MSTSIHSHELSMTARVAYVFLSAIILLTGPLLCIYIGIEHFQSMSPLIVFGSIWGAPGFYYTCRAVCLITEKPRLKDFLSITVELFFLALVNFAIACFLCMFLVFFVLFVLHLFYPGI